MNPDTQKQMNDAMAQAIGPLRTQILALQASLVHQTSPVSKQQLKLPLDPVTQTILRTQQMFQVSFTAPGTSAATAANYGIFFQADRPLGILSVAEVHATAGTDSSAVTLQLEKLTGTTAPGSGTSLLGTAFNLKGTLNTTQYGAILASYNSLAKGDRLSALLAGTPTAVANVTMTVYLSLL